MDGVITKYLYDGLNIIAEMDANNNITKTYTHNLAIDDPLALTTNGQTYYYHKDGLGSITSITDSSGVVVQKYEYDSFGNIVYTQNPAFVQPFAFTGREYDSETGLYHYRLRIYDQKTGTFTQKDPIGFKGGDANLYRYVWNRPTRYIDPFGLTGLEPVLVGAGAGGSSATLTAGGTAAGTGATLTAAATLSIVAVLIAIPSSTAGPEIDMIKIPQQKTIETIEQPSEPMKTPMPPGLGCSAMFRTCMEFCKKGCSSFVKKAACASGCTLLWLSCISQGGGI